MTSQLPFLLGANSIEYKVLKDQTLVKKTS